jgi:hypothetical protein
MGESVGAWNSEGVDMNIPEPNTSMGRSDTFSGGVASRGNAIEGEVGESMGVAMASKGKMKGSVESLALLDYEDTELNALDPDIAACLFTEPTQIMS